MTRAVEGFTRPRARARAGRRGRRRAFVNDSKATNIESALRAIQSFDTGLVVIIGGRFKGGDFADLRDALGARARGRGDRRGRAADPRRARRRVPVHDAADMAAAVGPRSRSARPASTVLLAPACSSFDMFRDYAERGRRVQAGSRAAGRSECARRHA